MPALSGAPGDEFRPRWGRWVADGFAALFLLGVVLGSLTLPTRYGLPDRLGIVAVAVFVAWVLHRLAAVRVETDEGGLTVVNVLSRRRLAWAQVLAVRLDPGDPWLVLDLSDGTALPAMGVQGSDGSYARSQAGALRALVDARATPPPPRG